MVREVWDPDPKGIPDSRIPDLGPSISSKG